MFFVLNPGRSGSKTIAEVLSQSGNCTCLHEPFPQLIKEAPQYVYHQIEENKLLKTLKSSRPQDQPDNIYGESNHKLSLIIPLLMKAFPEAQYVWLLRDGRDFVSSTLQRGWFSDAEISNPTSDWQIWRLRGDLSGAMTEEAWKAMNQFGKLCWLWNYSNEVIETNLKKLPTSRTMTIRIEYLSQVIFDLCQFLGIRNTDFIINKSNKRIIADDKDTLEKRINKVEKIMTWSDWTPEECAIFEKQCGSLMDRFYPEWKDGDGRWRTITPEIINEPKIVYSSSKSHPAEEDRGTLPDHLALSIFSIQKDVAEFKLLRNEFSALIRAFKALDHKHEKLQIAFENKTNLLKEKTEKLTKEKNLRIGIQNSKSYKIGKFLQYTLKPWKMPKGHIKHLIKKIVKLDRKEIKYHLTNPFAALKLLYGKILLAPGSNFDNVKKQSTASQIPVKPGRFITDDENNPMVAIGFVMLNLSDQDFINSLQEISIMQRSLRSFKPLIITDNRNFGSVYDMDYSLEYIIPRKEWNKHYNNEFWPDFVSQRLSEIDTSYGVNFFLPVTTQDLSLLKTLLKAFTCHNS